QCSTDPDFSWQGQWPVGGYWHTYTDPQSGKAFNVWEGHYTYPGTSLTFIPTWAGGMFEGLMANLVVPETTWGTHSFGLADQRWAQVQKKYATQVLHYFYDAVNPVTGAVGHRRLVLDQSMIMAAIDDALDGGALQRDFAA